MPLLYVTIVFVALFVGDCYYFEGRHVTSVMAQAKQFDAAAEQQAKHLLHFKM
jgi:hypothetical protein